MANEQIKFIVNALSKPPFSKSINLIKFDALEQSELVQILNDVLSYIEEQPTFDILHEPVEDTAVRFFEALRILRYKFPVDPKEAQNFRIGLASGDKMYVYPVLSWLVGRLTDLQKRAYLAKFLIHVYVPPDFQADPDVAQFIEKCSSLMEEFQNVHRMYDAAKADSTQAQEIRQDIKMMEDEKEQLTKRVEKLNKKVENSIKNKEPAMNAAKMYRLQLEHEIQLIQQKKEQRNYIVHAEQRMQRIQQQIQELRQQMESTKPEELIKSLGEENRVNSYLIEEKLPKEIGARRKVVQQLQKLASVPAMDAKDLEDLKRKMYQLNDEITELIEKKNFDSNPVDDQLAVFRQQANIVNRKKEITAENVNDLRIEAHQSEEELKQKKDLMRDSEGNEYVTSIQFKNYVNKLRSKTNLYKKKRSEMQDLAAELGVLSRTQELLKHQLERFGQSKSIESTIGGNHEISSQHNMLVNVDIKGKSAEEKIMIVKQVYEQVEMKKGRISQLLQKLRNLKEEYERLNQDRSSKKQQYDTKKMNFIGSATKLEQTIKKLQSELSTLNSTCADQEIEKSDMEDFFTKVKSNPNYAEDLVTKMSETEEETKKLKEELTNVKKMEVDNAKQMKIWDNVKKLLECKIQVRHEANKSEN